MKKSGNLKLIQLSVLTVLSLICIYFLLQDEVRQFVFSSDTAAAFLAIVCILLAANFIFLFLDFNLIKSREINYQDLYETAYTDSVSGLPGRLSCDALLTDYHDSSLPEAVGCIMIELASLSEVNLHLGHDAGNRLIRDFASILSSASRSSCFIGRNGGNKFLAFFEDHDRQALEGFLQRVDEKVKQHNAIPENAPIVFHKGIALNNEEHFDHITDLISLANRRLYQNPDVPGTAGDT